VARGSPCALDAIDPVTMWAIPGTSRALAIRSAMNHADKIRVKLDGVNLGQINGRLEAGEPGARNYTNYELHLIKTKPEYWEKAVFYKDGKIVPNPFPKPAGN
jgi:hypothetical protein